MNIDNDTQSNDLTQLSSREQLSALMDHALPEDQARFLLRRLQHDVELADSWERWRIGGDVLRGLAPSPRLPADFALRVSAAIRSDGQSVPQVTGKPVTRNKKWKRWGGAAALAATLAVVALMQRPSLETAPVARPAAIALAVTTAPAKSSPPAKPAPGLLKEAPASLVAATALVVAKPLRKETGGRALNVRDVLNPAPAVQAEELAGTASIAPANDIVTRPWPRSILSQYGNSGLTVGFGEHARPAPPVNPFAPPVFAAPPGLLPSSTADGAKTPEDLPDAAPLPAQQP